MQFWLKTIGWSFVKSPSNEQLELTLSNTGLSVYYLLKNTIDFTFTFYNAKAHLLHMLRNLLRNYALV